MPFEKGISITGTRGNKIDVIKKIAEGGFGLVYLGTYNDGKKCIVKQANIWDHMGTVSKNKGIIEKKLNIEKEILKRVGVHPHIPTLLDYDEEAKPPFMAMSYLRGKTIYEKIRKDDTTFKPLTEELARKYIVKLIEIVEYLHNLDNPVIHRDIKPANILVYANNLNLIDFGSSVAGWEGIDVSGATRIFTAGYGAPEQERGKESVDVRTDVYGIGTTLYFLVTGKDLRLCDECFYAPYDLRPASVFNPRLSQDMDDIIQRATNVFPEERYQNVTDMKNAVLGKEVAKLTKPSLQLGGITHTLYIKPGGHMKIGRTAGFSGAKKETEISIRNEYVSDVHARIERDDNNYFVKDMYSLNGTAVYMRDKGKWMKLDRGQKWRLSNGDKVALGYNKKRGPCIELIFREPD